jgi:hypothetical protein
MILVRVLQANVQMLGQPQLDAVDDLQFRLALGKAMPQFRNL